MNNIMGLITEQQELVWYVQTYVLGREKEF